MRKIKVLHIIKSLGRGGAEMLLPETLKLHNQGEFEFHYIYFLPWKNQMVSSIESNGGKVTCIRASGNLQMLLRFSYVTAYCRQNNIELIHCHLPWAGIVGRLVFKATGLPVLYTEHNKQERYHYLTRLINKFTFNQQTKVIAVSNDVARSIHEHIRPRIPVVTILNGVNTTHFQRDPEAGKMLREKLNIPDDALIVGTIAVFRIQKRLKEWLDIFKQIASTRDNLYAIVVGDGPLKDDLLRHRNRLGLENLVLMPGLQTEVRPWLSVIDIFMMTSEFEGLPLALLEAMSMECVIATTDAGGIGEIVHHNENGLMVPVKERNRLISELESLLNENDRRRSMSAAARKSVIESYSLNRMVEELERIYMDTLNREQHCETNHDLSFGN